MSRQFAIIGLGRLGMSMVRTLNSLGHEVLGIDADAERIQDLADELLDAHLVAADATDDNVLKDLNVGRFDSAAVVIGEDVEASILATAILKELGVPRVVARAGTGLHARVLRRVGADRVIEPEKDMGEQLARTMASPALMDYVDLGEDEALIEAEVPEKWVDRTLADLQLSRQSGLTVVALKHKGESGTIPRGDTVLREGDVMIIGGSKKDIDGFDLLQ